MYRPDPRLRRRGRTAAWAPGCAWPRALSVRSVASQPMAPSGTMTCSSRSSSSSRARYGRQRACSSGVGLLAGGAQRTAARTRTPSSRQAVAGAPAIGLAREPDRVHRAPEEVARRVAREHAARAVGAVSRRARGPTSRIRAAGSPKPGTACAQYVSSRKRATLTRACSSRQATRRGQAIAVGDGAVEGGQVAGRRGGRSGIGGGHVRMLAGVGDACPRRPLMLILRWVSHARRVNGTADRPHRSLGK